MSGQCPTEKWGTCAEQRTPRCLFTELHLIVPSPVEVLAGRWSKGGRAFTFHLGFHSFHCRCNGKADIGLDNMPRGSEALSRSAHEFSVSQMGGTYEWSDHPVASSSVLVHSNQLTASCHSLKSVAPWGASATNQIAVTLTLRGTTTERAVRPSLCRKRHSVVGSL
jgi:hypothetical protein